MPTTATANTRTRAMRTRAMSKKTTKKTTKKTAKKPSKKTVKKSHLRRRYGDPNSTMGVTVSMRISLIERCDRYAEALDLSRSAFFSQAMEDFLAEAEMHEKLFTNPRVMHAFTEALSKPGVLSSIAEAMSQDIDQESQQAVFEFLKSATQPKPPDKP